MGPGSRTSDWLVGRLRGRAATEPDRVLYIALADGEHESAKLTVLDLAGRAAGVAATLASEGANPGDRALVLDSSELDTLVGFLGCLAAGVSPVVLPMPRRPEHMLGRLLPVARDAEPVAVLSGPAPGERGRAVLAEMGAHVRSMIAVHEVEPGDGSALPEEPQHHRAFVQYTSGSTAAPRGVMLDHASLMANLEMVRVAMGMSGDSVLVSWNPLSHDMGLVIGALPAVAFGAKVIKMPPAAFVLRPGRWLRAITRYGGTHGCAPNFAYELCVDRVSDAERDQVDLSTWQVAVNGAEPVRETTRQRFIGAYGPRGFRAEAWCPGYGLAEATVLVSVNPPSRGSLATWVDRRALAEHRVVARPPGEDGAAPVVGCGTPCDGVEIAVVDPASNARRGPDEVGELWVRSAATAAGYFGRPDETSATFGGTIAGEDGGPYLRTGDLAFLREGEVHVVGRAKDLLIVHGLNVHAVDVELAAQDAHPAVRRGGVAAFAVDTGEREEVVVVVEVNGEPDEDEVADAVRRAVFSVLEVNVDRVALAAPRGVPKTTSGKTQRAECRRLLLADELPAPGRRDRDQALEASS